MYITLLYGFSDHESLEVQYNELQTDSCYNYKQSSYLPIKLIGKVSKVVIKSGFYSFEKYLTIVVCELLKEGVESIGDITFINWFDKTKIYDLKQIRFGFLNLDQEVLRSYAYQGDLHLLYKVYGY